MPRAASIASPMATLFPASAPLPQLKVLMPEDFATEPRTDTAEKLTLTPGLEAELAEKSRELESATPEEILSWAVDRFAPRFTMATAFGPEGMVILHMLAKIAPDTPIFNLDTGYQFQETLDLRDRVAERYGIVVELRRPELSVAEYEAQNGGPVYRTEPNRCCADRKLAVLHKAVEGMHAWA